MTHTLTELPVTDNRSTHDVMRIEIVRKALDLLTIDLLDELEDTDSYAYFNLRISELYSTTLQPDNQPFSTEYLRTVHTLFNNYYIHYQTALPGQDVSSEDKKRHFVYSETNDQLENMLCSW